MRRFNALDKALSAGAASGSLVLVFAVAAGCHALLEIDDIEFGDPGQGGVGAIAGFGGQGNQGNQGNQAGTGATGLTGTGGQGNQGIGGTTGGSGGDGGSGGTIPPCPEDCTNGVDDDDNGLVDCQDSCCSDHRCVPPVPSQWSGPVTLYIGTSTSVSCPGSWPTTDIDGATNITGDDPATCSLCSCGALSGATCSTPSLSVWTVAGCGGLSSTTVATPSGSCVAVGGTGPYLSGRGSTPTASGGTCTPSGGQATTVPYTIAEVGLVCSGSSGGTGCGPQEQCMPAGRPPFVGSVCIVRPGDRQCTNTGTFTDRYLIHATVSDTRGCSSCTCTPTGVNCGGSTTLFSATANCSGASTQVTNDDATCASTSNVLSARFTATGPTGGSCTANSSSPTGSVALSDPYTLCCLP